MIHIRKVPVREQTPNGYVLGRKRQRSLQECCIAAQDAKPPQRGLTVGFLCYPRLQNW